MNAIDASVALFKEICYVAEIQINNHFQAIDECDDKLREHGSLHVTTIADIVSNEVKIKPLDALNSIHFYLKHRSDLEIRPKAGICRVGDYHAKIVMTPKECAIKFYELVKRSAPDIINSNFDKMEAELKEQGVEPSKARLNFQALCDEIAVHLDIKSWAVYHCLRQYVEEERKDLKIKLGRHGGLAKVET